MKALDTITSLLIYAPLAVSLAGTAGLLAMLLSPHRRSRFPSRFPDRRGEILALTPELTQNRVAMLPAIEAVMRKQNLLGAATPAKDGSTVASCREVA